MPQFEQVQKVLGGRRITIFNEACKKLGIKEGGFVILKLEEDGLKIIPARVIPAEAKPKKTCVKKGE